MLMPVVIGLEGPPDGPCVLIRRAEVSAAALDGGAGGTALHGTFRLAVSREQAESVRALFDARPACGLKEMPSGRVGTATAGADFGPEKVTADRPRRTRSEVLKAREPRRPGCCDHYADFRHCDCLEKALPDGEAFKGWPSAPLLEGLEVEGGGPKIAPGNVVRLKSGGPEMTVQRVQKVAEELFAVVAWFGGDQSRSDTLRLESLVFVRG